MARKKTQKQRPNIVSVFLSPESKAQLDQVCAHRGMSIKMLLGGLILWFVGLEHDRPVGNDRPPQANGREARVGTSSACRPKAATSTTDAL